MDDPAWPHRRSPRADGYDYANAAVYFVTAVTHQRLPLFGMGTDDGIHLYLAGYAVDVALHDIPNRFSNVRVDRHMVMPNHVHALLTLDEYADGTTRTSVSAIMRVFKSVSAIEVNRVLGRTGVPVWQRSFHDRIVRDEPEYGRIWRYIDANPANWIYDHENPHRQERR